LFSGRYRQRGIANVRKASGDGLPAAKVIKSGSSGALRISRIADGRNAEMRFENVIIQQFPFLGVEEIITDKGDSRKRNLSHG